MSKSNQVFAPFDIPRNLIKALEATGFFKLSLELAPLDPDGKGVYALYLKDDTNPVYVGKTDKAGSVRKRLLEHAKKIAGREGIDVGVVRFRYLVIEENWLARACEEFLIEHYKPEWQGSGFGSHVPGAGRPGKVGPGRFDKKYPTRKPAK